jgi:hypothetical protein
VATTSDIPTYEPEGFAAGDSVFFDKSVSGYSAADGWTLTYAVRGPSVLDIDSTYITASGSGWQVRLTAAATAALAAGRYTWVSYVTSGGERHQVERGVFNVTENFAELDEIVSHNRKVLDQIEALIEGRTVADTESFQINGRAVNKTPLKDLLTMRGTYAMLVWQEENPGQSYRNHLVAFVGP